MKIMKGLLKKNQVIIYVIALMLVTAGYLNYTTNTAEQVSTQTAMEMEANDDMQIADIGDATLVNSEAVSENEVEENVTENTSADINITKNSNTTENNTANTVTQTSATVTTDEYFTKSKLERNTMYSQMIESYENVLNSSNSLETQKQSATEEIKKINDTKNSIMICENLISTKGFTNNIIFINGDSISVIIGAEQLQQEEVAQIQNIISRELNAEIENIHISTKQGVQNMQENYEVSKNFLINMNLGQFIKIVVSNYANGTKIQVRNSISNLCIYQ